MIERIIAYGCSWTAGSELLDHVHMGVSFDECNSIKQSYMTNGKNLQDMHKFIEKYNINGADQLNRDNSWAGLLARRLNKPFINRAQGGAGLDQIYFKLYNDYLTGDILSTDLVLVGLTTPYRVIRFTDNGIVGSLILGHSMRADNPDDVSLIKLFNDEFAVFHYFKTVKLLHALSDKINIRLQPMVFDINPYGERFRYTLQMSRAFVESIWEDCKGIVLLPDDYLRDVMGNGKIKQCGFGHQPLESHIELSDKMYNEAIKLL